MKEENNELQGMFAKRSRAVRALNLRDKFGVAAIVESTSNGLV